jgi:hypothetical protein
VAGATPSQLLGAGNRRRWHLVLALIAALLLPLVGAPGFGTTVAAAGNPSANLDQCANGGVGDAEEPCSSDSWVNGNLNASKAHYLEGDSVPYRLRFDDLDTSTAHTVTIEWDTTKAGKHALDHLTTFDRTESDANPLAGVAGLDPDARTTGAIPADSTMQGRPDWSGAQAAGSFVMWGGTIGDVSDYTYSGDWSGQTSARLTVTFTASAPNPVLAWGGHIGTRADWGSDRSAVAISGSPYHMRLIDLDGKGGNQDRSLSEDAVIYPASITIVKDATPAGSTPFGFVANGLTPETFSLVDDGDGPGVDTQTYTGLTAFDRYTITEPAVAGWTLSDIGCTDPDGGSSADLEERSATIDLDEGEAITCTFTNTGPPDDRLPDVSVTKTASPTTVVEAGGDVTFTFVVTNVGPETFTITSLSDSVFGPLAGDDDCKVGTELSPGASCELSLTQRLSGSASADHRNVFTAVVADSEDNRDTATDDAVVRFASSGGGGGAQVQPESGIRIDKTASASTVHEGDEVTYTYVVTNTGEVALRSVDVTDDRCGPVTYRSGDADDDDLLDTTETWTFRCTTALTTTTRNTATATGTDDLGRPVSDTDTALVVVIDPAIALVKTASVPAGNVGDVVSYDYVVTNPGDVHLLAVTVTDDRCGPVTYQSGDADGDAALDTDEMWRYTCEATLPDVDGPFTNVATVTAIDGLGAPLAATDDATVLVSRTSGGPAVVEPEPEPRRQLAFTGFDAVPVTFVALAAVVLGLLLVVLGRRERAR